MYSEHHHSYTVSKSTLTPCEEYVQWETVNTPDGSYEKFSPNLSSPPKKGEPILFIKSKTNDTNRNQYDLYVQYYWGNFNASKLWQEGFNLYSKQCDKRVLKIINKSK